MKKVEDQNVFRNNPMKKIYSMKKMKMSKFKFLIRYCFFESSFTYQHTQPYFDHTFTDDANFTGCIEESHVNNESVMMSDFILKYTPPCGNSLIILLLKFKPMNKNRHSQLESGFIKLGKQMKSTLDYLIKNEEKDPIVTGLLVDGYSFSNFMMLLKFDGIYLLTELANFYLLRSLYDTPLIPTIIEHFLQFKSFITITANQIDQLHQVPSSPSSSSSSSSFKKERKKKKPF